MAKLTPEQALNLYVDYLLPDFDSLAYLEYNLEHDAIHSPLMITVEANTSVTTDFYRVFFIVDNTTDITISEDTARVIRQYGDRYIIAAMSEHNNIVVKNNLSNKTIIGGAF